MFYDDDDRTEKYAIIVDVDKGDGTFVPLDIGESINEIMQMSKEHFMLLAKQFGKNIFENN
jgi:hypothetical protein